MSAAKPARARAARANPSRQAALSRGNAAPGGRAIFTIASANYLARAATLMQSVRALHPDIPRFVVLADRAVALQDLDLAAEWIPCEALDAARLPNMALWYSVLELNTALKPFAFRHLFTQRGFGQVLYLDPDIWVLAPLDGAFSALEAASLVLTPHRLEPGTVPSDHTILKSGAYNLGFCAMRADAAARRFLDFWAERCFTQCRDAVEQNLFTDQRWMDLAPSFVAETRILRDPGYNVAYWNLAERPLRREAGGGWRVGTGPLVFFHFSGFVVEAPTRLSRHAGEMAVPAAAAPLFAAYAARLRANREAAFSRLGYGFARFADGRPIEPCMRHWLLRAIDEQRLDPDQTLSIEAAFFDAPDESAQAAGRPMTRAMVQLWLDRPDLRRIFDIHNENGLEAFIGWFLGGHARADGVDGRTIAAAALLYGVGLPPDGSAVAPAEPPWPSLAARFVNGRAEAAGTVFEGDVVVAIEGGELRLPAAAALAWEVRGDLQRAFNARDPDGLRALIAWTITSGLTEGVVARNALSPGFLAWLGTPSALAAIYQDMPMSEGLVLTRHVGEGRDYLADWTRFPIDRQSRLAHAFWYAFVAPARFGWPEAMVAELRSWFQLPSEVAVGTLTLTRAALAPLELRRDVQNAFLPLRAGSLPGYVLWLLTSFVREHKVEIRDLDPEFPQKLGRGSAAAPELPNLLALIHAARPDLQALFDLGTARGRGGLCAWADANYPENYAGTALAALAEPAPPPVPRPPRPRALRTRLVLSGAWRAPTGRGEDLRASAASLLQAGFEDFLVRDRDGALYAPDGAPLATRPVRAEAMVAHANADTAAPDWRSLQEGAIAAPRRIGWWAWELDRLPRRWLHAYSFYDEIWASSRFAEAAFAREGLRPVRLVPPAIRMPEPLPQPDRAQFGFDGHGPDLHRLDGHEPDGHGLDGQETVFLFSFDFQSFAARKNPEAVVRAFLAAFPDRDMAARLVLKTQNGDTAPEAWNRLAGMSRDPRIELRDQVLGRDAVLGLVASADCYVSLHRSEGFGRGPAEAMRLGLPVISTFYSGTADFATPDCAFAIGYRLVRVGADEYPGVEGQSWAEPDIGQAAEAMRCIHEDREAAREVGRRGQERILSRYAPEISAAAMLAALGMAR